MSERDALRWRDSVRWERQWELYHRAVELRAAEAEAGEGAADRVEAFLASECGDDPELIDEVRSLLAVDRAGFLETPAASELGGELDRDDGLEIGGRVGAYRIEGVLGEGGMGTVYRAEQEGPLRREVALKVIRPGMDTAQVVRRFEAERQALALLEHPAIARVFDAGATTAGRPYFVMERVRGEPIDRFCDAERLTLDQRLELFLDVCSAVQHAHQKGIVHRDLKPSNILVPGPEAEPDNEAAAPQIEEDQIRETQIKVIDFGIAKFLDDTRGGTGLTVAGQVLGTPDVMAPEQVELGGRSIDSRTDVFGLGVVLYELLVGAPPFPPLDRSRSSWTEIETAIRTREAAPPSAGFARLDEERRSEIATARSATPSGLRRRLQSDLAWIVLRALRPDPEARYASASELASDVARFRAGLPVEAGAPGIGYRLRKLARRHWLATTVAAAFVLTVAGFGLALIQRTFELQDALGEAEAANETARAQGQRAESISGFLIGLLQRANLEETGVEAPTVRDALRLGIEQLRDGNALDDDSRLELLVVIARGLRSQGDFQGAREALTEALELVERTEPGSGNHAIVLLDIAAIDNREGDYAHAVSTLERVVEMLRAEGETRAYDVGNALFELAQNLRMLSHYDEAEAALAEAQDIFESLEGERAARRAGVVLDSRASIAKDLARTARSIDLYERALAIKVRAYGQDSLHAATGINNLATAHLQQGDYDRAAEAFAEAAEIFERLGLDADHRRRLGVAQNLAGVAALRGEPGGEADLRNVLARRISALGEEHPDVAASRLALGGFLLEAGRLEEAESLLRRSVAGLAARLGSGHPSLARARTDLGAVLLERGDLESARQEIEQAVEALLTVHREGSSSLAEALRWRAELRRREGDPEAAARELRRALSMVESRIESGEELDPWPKLKLQASLAGCLRELGRGDAAQDLVRQALSGAGERWPAGDPRRVAFEQPLQ